MNASEPSLEADAPPDATLEARSTEELPVATFRTGPEGALAAVNRAFVDLLGHRDRTSILGRDLGALSLDPEAVSLWRRRLAHAEDPAPQLTTLRRMDGGHVPVLIQGAPLRGGEGELLGIVGLALDLRTWSADIDTLVAQRDPRLGVGALPEVHHVIAESADAMDMGVLVALLNEEASDFAVNYANDASLEVLGLPRSEVLDASLDTLLPGLREARRGPGPTEITLPQEEGPDRTVEASLARTTLWGAPAAIVQIRDITKRRELELAIRAREEVFRTFITHATVGFYRTSPEGQILMANPALVDILSFDSMEELLARDLSTWGYPADRSRGNWRERVEREGALTEETTWVDARGDLTHVRESARVVRDGAGDVLYYEGTVEDLTELKANEVKLERENLRHRAIRRVLELPQHAPDFPQLAEGIAHAMTDILGTGRATVLLREGDGRLRVAGVHDAHHPDDPPLEQGEDLTPETTPGLWEVVDHLRRTRRPARVEDLLEAADVPDLRDGLAALDMTGSLYVPLHHNGNLRGILAIDLARRDAEFTSEDRELAEELGWYTSLVLSNALLDREVQEANQELRDANEDLKRSNADLQSFAHTLSHDLKEPNRMVRGFLDLFLKQHAGDLDAEARDLLEEAREGAERMDELIGGLLKFSRVDSRGDDLSAVDLAGVLEDVISNLQMTIGDTDAQVTWEDLPAVRGDPAQLGQVLQNLVENAIKYRREGVPPRIHVRADRREERWRVEVEDNGQGMSPGDRDRAFQLFQQLEGGEEAGGLGLGLALVKRIVERHGGEVGVESTPGEGSTFWFTVPAVDGEAT